MHPTLQDPVIFSGTIRSNLDPFATAGSDSHIWEALKRAGMEGFVAAMQGGVPALPRTGMNKDHAVTVTTIVIIAWLTTIMFISIPPNSAKPFLGGEGGMSGCMCRARGGCSSGRPTVVARLQGGGVHARAQCEHGLRGHGLALFGGGACTPAGPNPSPTLTHHPLFYTLLCLRPPLLQQSSPTHPSACVYRV